MKVIITRPKDAAEPFAEALLSMGAVPVYFPTIQIRPVEDPTALDQALQRLAVFDWVVFTSANAVAAVWERLDAVGLEFLTRDGNRPKVAAVGSKTAAALAAHGVSPHFTPAEFVAEAILPGLGELRGRQVLLPLADLAHDTLPQAITAAGGLAHVVTAYHTVPAAADPDGLAALRSGTAVITFTSGSTVRSFVQLVSQAGLDPFHLPGSPQVVCIGPKTARAAEQAGFQVDFVAAAYTMEGIAAVIKKNFNAPLAHEEHV